MESDHIDAHVAPSGADRWAREPLPLRPSVTLNDSPFDEDVIWEVDESPRWRDRIRGQGGESRPDLLNWTPVYYWSQAILGVILAGGAYGLPFFIVGAQVGMMMAATISIVLVVPFACFVRTVVGDWIHPLAAPAFGGLVGFLAISLFMFGLNESEPAWLILSVLLGPGAATLCGQIGALLATRVYVAIEMAWRKRNGTIDRRWRFSIRMLLTVTAWAAAAAAIISVAGLATQNVLALIAIWTCWQTGLLWFWRRRAIRKAKLPQKA